MTPRPLTSAEIALHEQRWQARDLFGLAIATIQECGEHRPACVSLRRTIAQGLLELNIAQQAAERRLAERTA